MKNNWKKSSRILPWLLGSIFLAYIIIIPVIRYFKNPGYGPVTSLTIPADYTNIFTDQAKEKLVLNASYLIKGREPFSVLKYDSSYFVLVYKMKTVPGSNLKDLLKHDSTLFGRSIMSSYNILDVNRVRLSFRRDSVSAAGSIRIKFYGDSLISQFESDSLFDYSINLQKFVVGYGDKSVDLTVEPSYFLAPKLPIRVVLSKSERGLYFVFLWNMKGDATVTSDVIKELIRS